MGRIVVSQVVETFNDGQTFKKRVISMERMTWKELMGKIDISGWRWNWLGDLNVVQSLGNGRYVIRLSARKIIDDDPTFVTEDSENGVIRDTEGRTYLISDWKDDLTVYCEVEKTDDGIIPVDTLHEFLG